MQVVLPRVTLTLNRDAAQADIQLLQDQGVIAKQDGTNPDPAMLFDPSDSEAVRDAKIERFLQWYIPQQIAQLASAMQMQRFREVREAQMRDQVAALRQQLDSDLSQIAPSIVEAVVVT